jgi:meiotically up-regulated gene 157 (Mug157) protein
MAARWLAPATKQQQVAIYLYLARARENVRRMVVQLINTPLGAVSIALTCAI